MSRNIFKNGKGVFELPIQYLIAAIVAGVVIFLVSMAAYNMWKEYEIKKVINEVKKIVDEAEAMYSTSIEGTKITLDVNLPNSVRKVVFGSEDERLRNHYYILMDWGVNKSFFAKNAEFSKAILYEGKQSVVIELVKNEGGERYIKIYHI